MTNRWSWMITGLATLMAVSLLGAPKLAAAERCSNARDYYISRNNHGSYDRQDFRGYGYRGDSRDYRYQSSDYRNDAYRNRSYRNSGYSDTGYYDDGYRSTRSAGKSAAIIGGSAAAGAAIGGLTGGVKGAAIGAAVGGVGGLIYDRATRNGNRW